MAQKEMFFKGWFWIPVMNSFWRVSGEGISPREAGLANMTSSNSAMCISPMGIINACNPRQAALETYELAGLLHHNFSRDAACSMAAAVAEAFNPDASVDSILTAAHDHLPLVSAKVIHDFIQNTLALARETGDYAAFRQRFYAERILPGSAMLDARETVPVALALVYLAEGDPRQTIILGANFGRDADTIASMAGALSGAPHGAPALPAEWIAKIRANSRRDQSALAAMLVAVSQQRAADQAHRVRQIQTLQPLPINLKEPQP